MEMKTIEQQRIDMANRFWSYAVERQITSKDGHAFHKGAPFHVLDVGGVKGLRVCIIKMDVGHESDRLLKLLTKARLPHLIPWTCPHPPVAYSDDKWVVIEAPWPLGLERADIQLFRDVRCRDGLSGDVVMLGQTQAGVGVNIAADDMRHILLGGETGAGKTVAIRSIAAQLSQPRRKTNVPPNQLILVDGKRGGGLGAVNGLRGQVGPLAVDMAGAVNALGWCVNEMNTRYDAKLTAGGGSDFCKRLPRLCVFVDEFQVWTSDANNAVTALMNLLVTQGREANVHVVAGTQKTLVGVFGKGTTGSTTGAQFATRIGLRMEKAADSRVLMGDPDIGCHLLLGEGDSYVKIFGNRVRRVQIARIIEATLQQFAGGKPMLAEWPEFDTSILERETARVGRRAKATTAEEYAIGIETVEQGLGRPHFRKQFSNGRRPGADRARKVILPMCEEIVRIMRQRGVVLK
jgi:DNA segregation ATPase FtsK/SpoIIIE-like protein